MKTYNVYTHPTHDIEAVKVGISWPAFFFGLIWMLVKKLWKMAGLWFAIYVVLLLVEGVLDQPQESNAQSIVYLMLSVVYFAMWLIPAFKGNKWREESLAKRGYELQSTVEAQTPDAAVAEQASKQSLLDKLRA